MNLVTQNNTSRTAIVLCDECKGSGIVEHRVGEDEYEYHKCDSCHGSGRLQETVTTKYEPYKEVDENEL